MLQFTKEVDYGIQLISALTKLKGDDLLSLRNFSKDAKISFLFLQRIAKKLREAKIVKSTKGAQGGYQLDKEFKNLTIKNIVEALEGEYAVTNCLKKGCHCPKEGKCDSQKVFKAVNERLVKYLSELRLSEVI
ncbi:MAG: Rrf2 family transcriptional regulator [Candidatus Magasanikiibacteriota bacterium]